MEAIVLDEGGRTVRRQQIFDFFQQHRSLDERRDFLKSAYTDTYVEILVDSVRVGYRGRDNGLLMWAGSYLSRTAESVFSWSVVAELTENLMERGAYKIKLGLQNAPVMAEQMTLFGAGGQMPVYEPDEAAPPLFPSQGVPQAVIDKALYTAGNESGSASRVAAFYMREHPEKENALFLRREFGTENGRGIEHEGCKYAVWFMEDGIHLARGSSVRTGYSRTTVSWEQASARILELLNAGTYRSQAELEQAPDKALHDMADALLLTARDLTEEGKTLNLLPQTREIYHRLVGFPECVQALTELASDEKLSELAEEYHAFQAAYAQNKNIMRFRLSPYDTHRIGMVLDGADLPERSFTAQSDFMRQCKLFITQDEIDHFFLAGNVDSRLEIYSHFCYPHTPQEHQEFIKDDFGEYSGGSRDGCDYTKTRKGLTYKREYEWKTYDTVQLTIPNVVKEYQTLLAQKRFPGEDALAAIPQYEKERLARTVYFAFSGLNGDVPRPYPENADFYSAVPAIQTQLTDPAQVQTMRETLSAALDTLAENDRCYDCVRNAKEQLSALEDGSFSLFNHRHESLAAQLSRTLPAEQESMADPEALEPPVSEPEPTPQEPLEPEPILPPVPRQRDRVDATEPLYSNGINYRITDDALGAGTPSERFANNLAAIRLLKAIEQENRTATAEEQETLAKYVGWGGLADCFDEKNSRYAELKSLLSDTEYTAARESTLTAFYTPPVVIRSIYQALEQMGFTQGNILEPACGTGNFLGLLPGSMAASKLYGVELDDVSGRIARQLYQRSSVTIRGFEKVDFPDCFFDAAIGNVPFGQFKVADRRYDRLNLDAEKKLQRQMVHQAAVKAKKAAQETSRSAAHVAKAAARAIVAAVKSLASAGGIVALLVVVLLVGLVAATAASPFGIFFSGEHTPPDAVPVSAAVAEVNGDFNARLEALQDGGAYDNVVVDGAPADWPEVLAVFASKVAGADGSYAADVVTIDRDRVEKLKAVFWDMTVIDSYVEVIEHGDSAPKDDVDDSSTERILHIVITAKTASEMPALYGFTARQTSAMNELLAQRAMLTELAGSLSINSAEAGAVLEKLPDGIAPDRKAVIQAACSLVGKVNYFWGGKSLVIGWDSRWGRVEKVTAAGSRSTGTCRPYGLDCSGFVDWVFYNATDGKYVIGHGGGAQAQHAYCTAIAWSDAQPGDLVFYPNDTHVGIVAGRDGSGNLQIIHCSSGHNNVVVTGSKGFTNIGRPACYAK